MDTFYINHVKWQVRFVTPNNNILIDRTGKWTVAVTDLLTNTVYLSTDLRGNFLMRVFIHELSHCTMISYGLIDEIHNMVYPEHWIDAEEWICNYIADFGMKIFDIAFGRIGYDAWKIIPKELEGRLSNNLPSFFIF